MSDIFSDGAAPTRVVDVQIADTERGPMVAVQLICDCGFSDCDSGPVWFVFSVADAVSLSADLHMAALQTDREAAWDAVRHKAASRGIDFDEVKAAASMFVRNRRSPN